jgi:hypothetical protein
MSTPTPAPTFVPCVVETPFRSTDPEVAAQLARYLPTVMRACFDAGLSPYASHDTIPRMLAATAGTTIDHTDADADLRSRGIAAGYAWSEVAQAVVFGVDHGWSSGMKAALERIQKRASTCGVYRYCGGKLARVSLLTLVEDIAARSRKA